MSIQSTNPNYVVKKRVSMDERYPNIREHITRYMKDKTGIVYLGDIMHYLSQYYGFKFIRVKSVRFEGDFNVRQCIFRTLKTIGWERVGTKRMVDSPGFVKVEGKWEIM